MGFYSHQQVQLTKDNVRPKLSLNSISSESSSDSSISSVLLSLCPVAINSNHLLLPKTNPSIGDKRLRGAEEQLIVKKDCFQVTADEQGMITSHTSNIERKFDKNGKLVRENEWNETVISSEGKMKKKLSYRRFIRLLNLQRECQTAPTDSPLISTYSCLRQLLLQPKLFDETDENESTKCPLSPPPVVVPICIEISPERRNQFKQRQIELDHVVNKLLQTIRIDTTETIKQISKYWSYFKQISLEKYQSKPPRYQLFDYLLKSTPFTKQLEFYCEENDEIKAALQVLSTTLTIVHHQHSFSTLNQLFDHEEKIMLEYLQDQLEFFLSSYIDALAFMRARFHFYQSNCNEENNYDWIKIIQIDYPCLIEKISNNFLIQIPQIEQILIQMLKHMKKHLLNIPIEMYQN